MVKGGSGETIHRGLIHDSGVLMVFMVVAHVLGLVENSQIFEFVYYIVGDI